MPRRDHVAYRLILKLYPRVHRELYGEQMVQTLDDLLGEYPERTHHAAVWLRVVLELPKNLFEEHVNNLKEMSMSGRKRIGKRLGFGVGIVALLAIGIVVAIVAFRPAAYQPTTLAKVPRSKQLPACQQPQNNTDVTLPKDTRSFIENAVVTSIIDVPAGTNVDVYLKSYQSAKATGSAIYGSTYGRYNFVAEKSTAQADQGYTGGWKITSLNVCK